MPFENIISATATGGSGNTFDTIQTDAGTSPVASGASTLTLTSSDASVIITGNAGTDTVDFSVVAGSGDVSGPASSTDNAIVRFDGLTGKLIQNSVATLSDAGLLSTANVTVTNMTAGSVIFAGTGGAISQDNSALYYEDTNNLLTLGSQDTTFKLNTATFNIKLNIDMESEVIGIANHIHNDFFGPNLYFARTRGSHASPSIVQTSDAVGSVWGHGWTGNATNGYLPAAAISFNIASSGTISTTSMPGEIGFFVTANGANNVTEAARIYSDKTISMAAYGTGIAHFSSAGLISSSLIVNADVSGSAAIAYSKLNLSNSIVNADVNASAAIAITKIANGTANQLIKANAAATANEFATLSGGTGLSVTFGAGTISLANTGVTSIIATANQTTVSGATGAVTIGTVQSIGAASSPTFTGLNLSGLTATRLVQTDASKNLISVNPLTAFIGGTANRVTVTDDGDGTVTLTGPQDIATGSSPTFTGLTLSSLTAGSVIFAGTSGVISQDNTNFFYTNADDSLGVGPAAATNSVTVGGSSIKTRLASQANKAGTDLIDLALWNGSTTAGQAPRLEFLRNKNTIASPTVVASGDELGMISFDGYDGTDYEMAAMIVAEVDGTPGSNDMPGRLVFKSSLDGTASPIEFLRLSGGATDKIQIYNGQPTVTATEDVMSYIPTVAMNPSSGTVNHAFFNYMPTVTVGAAAGAILQQYAFQCSPTVTFNSGLAHIYYAFLHQGTFTYTANPAFANTFSLFVATPTLTSSTASVIMPGISGMYQSAPSFNAGNANVGTTGAFITSYTHAPQWNCTGASSTMTVGTCVAISDAPTFKANTAGSALTITNRQGFWFKNFASTVTGTVTVTNNVGVDLDDQSASSGNLTVTNLYGIRSSITSGTNRFFLYGTGSAQSVHKGNLRLGDTTAPTALLDIIGKMTVDTNGKVTKYNNITTVANGVPSELAQINLTAQAAAIATATLYAVPASSAGPYRISWTAKVTRAATTSSVLGALTITYTNPDGVVVTQTAPGFNSAGTVGTTNTTNSTTSTGVLTGIPFVVDANSSTNIQYAFAYTSVGATSMQYSIRIRVEAM